MNPATKDLTDLRALKIRADADKAAAQRARWEFNLIKVGGNVGANLNSGNSVRSAPGPKGKSGGKNGKVNTGTGMLSAPPTKARNASKQPGIRYASDCSQDELIGLISGDTTFKTTLFPIQPGMASTFPWASKVASLYERYRVISLEFYYKPLVSPYATAGQQGKVVLSTDYDAAEGAPTSIQQVLATDPHADAMPYQAISLVLDPQRMGGQQGLFVRSKDTPGTDIKTYDGGNLAVSVDGMGGSATIGELHVRYHFQFLNPRISEPSVPACNCVATLSLSGNATIAGLAGWIIGNNAGGAPYWEKLFGLFAEVLASGDVMLPDGNYVITLTLSAQAAGGNAGSLNTISGFAQTGLEGVYTNVPKTTVVYGYGQIASVPFAYSQTFALKISGGQSLTLNISNQSTAGNNVVVLAAGTLLTIQAV